MVGNDLKCLLFNYITLGKNPDRHFLSYDLPPLIDLFNDYDRLNFDGMVDCQVYCYWDTPANLQLYGAGRVFWNKHDNNPDRIRKELFTLLFGEKCDAVINYCDHMNILLRQCGNYHETLSRTKERARRLADGLIILERELDSSGSLPHGREACFRASLNSLKETAEACL